MSSTNPAIPRGLSGLSSACFLLFAATVASCGGSPNNLDDGSNSIAASSPSLRVDNFALPEGASGENPVAKFRVSLSTPSQQQIMVNANTRAETASAGDDYAETSATIIFKPGETEQFVSVMLIGDDLEEANETFALELSQPVGASLSQSTAIGTIANDDSPCEAPAIGASNPWLEEQRLLLDFSHRGGADDYPENTLYAYKQSLLQGADVLEMDIYENADGDLIVIHDATVDRTTNHSGDVSSFTTAELKAMDAAYWFVPNRGSVTDANDAEYIFRGIATGEKNPPEGFSANDFRIPTLEEILQTFPNALINIELKPDPDSTGSYEGKVADLVVRYGRSNDVVVASFVDNAGLLFKAAAPCVSTSFSTGQAAAAVAQSKASVLPVALANPAGHHAFQVPMELGVEVVNQKFVDDAHFSNIAVHVWTINDCETMVELLNMGVDAIMTDRPLMLEQLLNQTAGEWSCDSVVWPLAP